MFTIDNSKTIHITRGDVGTIEISANTSASERYTFKPGDVVRLRVFTKMQHEDIIFVKDVAVDTESTTVDIPLDKVDTKIGGIINRPVDYWYEVELNPDTFPQTIIGYDNIGPKIFRLYPEGGDVS